MRRDVQEGQARCLSRLGRHKEALDIAEKMVNNAKIFILGFRHENIASIFFFYMGIFWKNNLHVYNPSGCSVLTVFGKQRVTVTADIITL